ncbi:MAG: CHAT domain-containing protein [Acidobacteria bacterium]|nr:MAG: CHAT domain-containing protein [Acidobacteriota bacterium]
MPAHGELLVVEPWYELLEPGERVHAWRAAPEEGSTQGTAAELTIPLDLEWVLAAHLRPELLVEDAAGNRDWRRVPAAATLRPSVVAAADHAAWSEVTARSASDAGEAIEVAETAAALWDQALTLAASEPARAAWWGLEALRREPTAERLEAWGGVLVGSEWRTEDAAAGPGSAPDPDPPASSAEEPRTSAMGDWSLSAAHRSVLLRGVAWVALELKQWQRALEVTLLAQQIEQAQHGGLALLEARNLLLLGRARAGLNQLEEARADLEQAVDLARRAASEPTVLLAQSLMGASNVLFELGDYVAAIRRASEAVEICERLAPGSLDHLSALSSLARAQWGHGELAAAQRTNEQALRLLEAMEPAPEGYLGMYLNNLGLIASNRGDYQSAELYHRRSLGSLAQRRLEGERRDMADVINNLAIVHNERGEYEEADALYAEALEIYRQEVPGSIALARCLNNRANNARRMERYTEVARYLDESQAITAQVAPDSRTHALGRIIRASTLDDEGRSEEALAIFELALQSTRSSAPGSLRVAHALEYTARMRRKLGRPEAALAEFEEALEIVERTAPDSSLHAQLLHNAGRSLEDLGRAEEARRSYCAAVDALESQKLRLGGNRQTGSAFDRFYLDYYGRCASALVDAGEPAAAFARVEAARVRGLLGLIAARDLELAAELPPELRAEQRELAERFAEAYAELGDDARADRRQEVEQRLAELASQRTSLERALRQADPRYAELTAVEPLDAAGALAVLPPSTLLISYLVGEQRSLVFALGRAHGNAPAFVDAAAIELGRDELVAAVDELREAVQQRDEGFSEQARELWRRLLGPVAERIDGFENLLISPDGPLHTLPFQVLIDDGGRYLVERAAVATVQSATLLRTLRQLPAANGDAPIVVLADPHLPDAGSPAAERLGGELAALGPLPAAAREARALSDRFPGRVVVLGGREAREDRFRSLAPAARWIHIASHGFVDERVPLDSGLVLAPAPEVAAGVVDRRADGLLQAWEIFESLDLRADLVTLSACETGLGAERFSEGLVGLTRAFQYAGARSIVASLWQVSDESTAELMDRFYEALSAGRPKSEALRAAQLALLKGSAPTDSERTRAVGGVAPARGAAAEHAHPYHWAAFQLIGDLD